jgi:hypothetical protein
MSSPILNSNVADPGCLSRIPDPKTATKERGEKKWLSYYLFCSHKFHKIENYLIFEMLKTKIWPNFQRIIELFTQKLSLCSQKYGFGIRDPGYMGQKGTADPQHFLIRID